MRRLHLLRHAKSSWEDPSLRDHDRPLAPRGERAAPYVAEHMRAHGIVPDVVLCSTAVRTRQTLDLLGDAVPAGADVRFDEQLYDAGVGALLERVRQADDDASELLLIGHNPGMQMLAMALAWKGELRERLASKFPTAALATLTTDIDTWADLREGRAQVTGFVTPNDLGAPR